MELRVNLTLVFLTSQAILEANAGAIFISPFIGRLDDIGRFGIEIIREIVQIFKNDEAIKSEVLVVSTEINFM